MYRRFLRKHGWRYIPGGILLVVCSYVQTFSPIILGEIFDLFEQGRSDLVLTQAFVLVGIALAVFVLRFSWRYFIMGNARYLECTLRQELFEHLQTLPPSFFQKKKSGDLMAYAVNDIGAIRMTFGPALSLGLTGIVTGIASVATMITQIHPALSLYALAPIPVIIVLILILGTEVRKRFTVVQRTFAEVSDRVNENVGGIRVVKAYVQEKSEINRFEDLNNRMKRAGMRMTQMSALVNPLIQTLFGVSFVVGIFYGSDLVKTGVITVGDFVAFNSFLVMIMRPVISIGRIINIIQRGRASQRRLADILNEKNDIIEGTVSLTKPRGELEVRNLTYTYPGASEPVLTDVSFTIKRGRSLGIIGHTGSGKTALTNAVMKFSNVPDGSIFLDGRDVNTLTLESVREAFGCVPQDGFLFSDTIRSNIQFFAPDVDDSRIDEAARLADIYETIAEFPDGYETMLGERGVNLSGGQKQRISIARALVKNPAIYLFDDALAAVDTRTEERITENLRHATQNRTTILIAHRASVIKHCDEILVLDHGRITERGTHDELIALNGEYAALWRIQSGGEEAENEHDAV